MSALTAAIPGRARFGHLAVLCLGGIMLAVNRTLLYPAMDRIAADLGLTAAQAGLVASTYFVGLLTAQVGVSLYSDRVGLKRFLVVAYFLAALAELGVGLWATSYPRLLFFVALVGLTMGVFWPVGYSLAVGGVPADKRGRASAIVGAGLAGGHALGPALGGVLFSLTANWRLPFAWMAAPIALLAVAFIFFVREPARPPEAAARASWLPVLRDRQMLRLFAAGFCALYAYWVVAVWGPAFLQAERGLSLAASGLYVALPPAAATAAALLAGSLSDRIGRRRLSWIMFLVSGAALGAAAVAREPWALLAALAVFGLSGKFAWDPVNVAWLADLVARDRAKSLGLVVALASICGMTASVIGPVVNGWIRDQTGSLQGAFFLGAALALAGAALCASARDQAAPRPARASAEQTREANA